MENNSAQEKLNKRILEKVQNKIATEEFKNKEKIKKAEKTKDLKLGLKVASFLIVGILAANVYTYATFDENLLSFIISRIGIISDYAEKSVVVEKEENSINNNKLILSSYTMDDESLVVTYKLKLSKKVENFEDALEDRSKIVSGSKTYNISENGKLSFYKISDTEYEILKIYDVKNLELSDDAKFITSVTLYEELDGPIQDKLGVWEFDVNISKNNNVESKVYTLENKKIDLYNVDGSRMQLAGNDESFVSARIEELRITDIGTKMIFSGFYSYTSPDIKNFVEVLDENGNVLLENNTEELTGNSYEEILFSKVDLNSKITINIDVVEYPNNIIAEGSITLDLSKDLIEKQNKQEVSNYKEYKWNEISFLINDNMETNVQFDNEKNAEKIYIDIYTNKYDIENLAEISKCTSDLSLDTYCSLSYIINLANGETLSENNEGVYLFNNYVELTYAEIVEIAKTGKIIKEGKEITIDSLKENSIYNISTISDKVYSDKEVYKYEVESGESIYNIYILEINNCKYEFKISTKLDLSSEIEKFVSSIKINDR